MPVFDPDTPPADPFRTLVKVVVDAEAQTPVRVRLPSAIRPSCREARQICDQQGPTGSQNPRHLGDGALNVTNVDEGQVADDKIERTIGELQRLGTPNSIITLRVAAACLPEQFLGRIDPYGRNPGDLQHSAEAPLAATHVQRGREPALLSSSQVNADSTELPTPAPA